MLPTFIYHPDPVATGNFAPSDNQCRCCEKSRGVIYTGSVYSAEKLRDLLCPWCIADGSASEMFDAEFSDGDPLKRAGLSSDIVEEITRRTPGYSSWQQEVWLTCCNDACEFHGDASRDELRSLSDDRLIRLLSENNWKPSFWTDFIEHYQPGGGLVVYKFVCRHCKEPKYGIESA